MNEDIFIQNILDRNEQFLRTHVNHYIYERDEEKRRKYQIAAASQGCFPLIQMMMNSNSLNLNSELLAVAIFNQQIETKGENVKAEIKTKTTEIKNKIDEYKDETIESILVLQRTFPHGV